MKLKILSIVLFLAISTIASGQTQADLNKTDQQGRKQGHWIKKYPSGNIMYEGTFSNDKPVGEFKRYNTNNTLKSILIYSSDSREADATIYHSNGFVASQGRYVDQLKEGKWRFYSSLINGYLINEETYLKNVRNGPSLRYYPDSTVAEKVIYVKGIREGEWLQYHENGRLLMKSFYLHGLLNGKFEAWYSNGKPEYTGTYKNNMRDGNWKVFSDKGILKYEINYTDGVTKDRQVEDEVARFFDRIEKSSGNITDPEKNR
jgi:antitoxin component YwqK of YwqJK toxin-antitoxin module